MGFDSHDSLLNNTTVLERRAVTETMKVTGVAHTAGGWHMSTVYQGYPNISTHPGTDLLFQSCDERGGDAFTGNAILGIQNGGPVEHISAGMTKHLLSVAAHIVAAAGAPWFLKLVDLEGYYRLSGTNVTGVASRVLINTNTFTANAGTDVITYTNDWSPFTKVRFTTTGTLPAGLSLGTDYWLIRLTATTANVAASYADAIAGTFVDITDAGSGTHTLRIQMRNPNGVGCEAFFMTQTQPTAGGPTLSASSYTNQAGTAARVFQGSPTMGATADAYASRVLHSGNAAGRYGPFLPKMAADTGIQSIESFTFSGGTAYTGAGVLALCIARPLGVNLMLPATGVLVEKDFVNQLMALPRIRDGACLAWMIGSTGLTTAASPFLSTLDMAWGG